MITAATVSTARSLLFVPGDRPERFAKAAAAGADLVIIDLEDAVAPDAKAAARRNVTDWLDHGGQAIVRINAAETPWHSADIAALGRCAPGVMLPKAERAEVITAVADAISGAPIIALVETARGARDCDALAEARGTTRIALGNADLGTQLGVAHTSHRALAYVRGRLVLCSAAAGLPAPIDGVTTAFDSTALLAEDLALAVELGFSGKLCIHPTQVAAVNGAFLPTDAELAWANRVVAAAEGAPDRAIALDGAMIDAPLVQRAIRLLARSETAARAAPAGSRI